MTKDKEKSDILEVLKNEADKLPILGGTGGHLFEYASEATKESLEQFKDEVLRRVRTLEKTGDTHINRDEFTELFKSAHLVALRSIQSERRQAAVEILANLFLKPGDDSKLSYNELEHFMRALESLSLAAISAFSRLFRITGGSGRHAPSIDTLKDQLSLDPHLLMGLMRELESWGFVDLSTPQVKTQNYGNSSATLSELGSKFFKAIQKKEIPA